MNKYLLALLVLTALVAPAYAALDGWDNVPGDACTPAEEGHTRRNASANLDETEITLICDGTVWQSAAGGSAVSSVWLTDGPGGPAEIYYSGGNVGIGTNDPMSHLDVRGTTGSQISLSANGTATFDMGLILQTLADGNANTSATNKRWIVYGRGDGNADALEKNNFGIGFWNGTAWNPSLIIDDVTQAVGLGTYTPRTRLDVAGSLRIADGNELCNVANHEGAIRYVAASDAFQMCRSSATGWEAIGSGSGSGITAITGDVTASGTGSVAATLAANAVTNAKMADDAIGIAELSATGAPSATTYLRGDNTWGTPTISSLAWSGLTGVPAGLADGTDDGIVTETDPQVGTTTANNFCRANAGGTAIDCATANIGTTEIADGAVTAAKTSVIGTLTEGKWCTVTSGKIVCTSDAPSGGGGGAGYTEITPPAITAAVNNWAPSGGNTADVIHLSSTAANLNLTGLSIGQTLGRRIILHNAGSNAIRLPENNTGSTSVNRFDFGNAGGTSLISLPAGDYFILRHDGTEWTNRNEFGAFFDSFNKNYIACPSEGMLAQDDEYANPGCDTTGYSYQCQFGLWQVIALSSGVSCP